MKFAKVAIALAAVALLALAGVSTASAKHHAKKCPSGKHRNGTRCVKNKTAGARNPGSSPGTSGSNGPTGPIGPTGPTGPIGPTGPAGQPPVITRSTVYDNISSLQARPSSYGFAALDFDELGSLVSLAGAARNNPVVTVDMSVYACQSGSYSSGCSTTPGTKFAVPMTVRVYAVGANQEPGALIGTETVDQQLFYRPTADPSCSTAPYAGGFKNAAGECVNGELEPVSFNLAGVTLPDQVIVSLSYDTSSSGYGQNPPAGGPADSLNVALAGPAAVGTTLRETEGSYFASGSYGSADDVFGYQADEEPGESEGQEPAIAISATN